MADGWPEIAVHEAGPFDVPVIAFLHAECCADGIGGGSLEPGRDRHVPVPARQLRLPGDAGRRARLPRGSFGGRRGGCAGRRQKHDHYWPRRREVPLELRLLLRASCCNRGISGPRDSFF